MSRNQDKLKQYYLSDEPRIKGFATELGTKNYSLRSMNLSNQVSDKHFRTPYHDKLSISSVGFGSYMGAPDSNDDLKMFNAVIDSIESGGINLIDTAINYRYMKSERTIGAALKYLKNEKNIERNELFICSKTGYIPEDQDNSVSVEKAIKNMIADNLITAEDVIGGCHSMHPNFLQSQLENSLSNLGIETLDLMYLLNAAETQMPLIGEQAFFDKLAKAFEFYELKIQENKIKSYGLATWMCFRAKTEEKNLYLSLEKVVELAQKIGGENHGFKYVQTPCNIIMPEIFSEKWHQITNEEQITKKVQFLTAARLNKINVISSSPLMQGAMMQVPLPQDVFKCDSLAARHVQFIRSIPAESLLSTLVGLKSQTHVNEILQVINHNPIEAEEFWDFLQPSDEVKQQIDQQIQKEKDEIFIDKK